MQIAVTAKGVEVIYGAAVQFSGSKIYSARTLLQIITYTEQTLGIEREEKKSTICKGRSLSWCTDENS